MFKRYELHNHTIESDANISCEQLIDLMVRDQADAFALTDHNTISGHRIVKEALRRKGNPIQCVYGMEYTTYYGHILCLNLDRYVPWDSIDRRHPEKLFEACRRAGALSGIAHPFSYGDPFAQGCRFEMTVSDYSVVDFIEAFNNPEPLRTVNEPGLKLWEDLTLKGEKLAITAGMDLHGEWDMSMNFATYVEVEDSDFDASAELARAIRAQRTWVSKGMILAWEDLGAEVRYTLVDAHKPGYSASAPYTLVITDADGSHVYPMSPEGLVLPKSAPIQIPKLYAGDPIIENLVCVAPAVKEA